ncbi:hypothetical protein J4422_03410 [Candidatus Pacearchaeota archaeon]|nr:hypothetical protein [Candidatus Pacearchaeota archaeon]
MRELVKNKKAQTGDTITWLVATVVIVVVLAVSIFAASAFFHNEKDLKSNYFKSVDTLASKSLFSYTVTKDASGKLVYQQLKEEENLNYFNGNLALKVFRGLFQKDYLNNPNNIWLGFVINTEENANGKPCAPEPQFCIFNSIENNYFGKRVAGDRNTELGYHTVPFADEKIMLDDKRNLELNLIGK